MDSRGDRWKYLGDMKAEKDMTISVYLDTDSIEIYDNIRKFWIKYVVKKKDDKNVEGYVIQRGYWEVDCFDREALQIKRGILHPFLQSSSEVRTREYRKSTRAINRSGRKCPMLPAVMREGSISITREFRIKGAGA